MRKMLSSDWWKENSGKAVAAGILLLLPLGIFLLQVDPGALAGCGTYGYGCSYPACFAVEISTNYGYTWQRGSAWVYVEPGTEINLYLRVALTTNVSGVEGWSLGVRHFAETLEAAGGEFEVMAAADGPDVQTVKGGARADFCVTRPWTCGFTQGLVIDMGETHRTMGPRTNFFAVRACYRLRFPAGNYQVHTVRLEFRDDVGVPPVENIVTRNAESLVPCKDTLTLYVQPWDVSTPSYCPLSPMELSPCEEEGGEGLAGSAGGGPMPLGGVGPCTVDSVRTILSDDAALSTYPAVTRIMLWQGTEDPPPGGPNLDWTLPDYDETGWYTVDALPIGYGVEPLGYDLNQLDPPMEEHYSTFYVRIHFQPSRDSVRFDRFLHSTLEVDLGVDDGFVAYLNGIEIRRMNAPLPFRPPQETYEPLGHWQRATAQHSHTDRVSGYHDLHAHTPEGDLFDPDADNVLAIHVLNYRIDDSDCVLSPRLHVRKRGPFVARASALALSHPTAFEVVVRLPEPFFMDYDVFAQYSYTEGGEQKNCTSDLVIAVQQVFEVSGPTIYRVQIPGARWDAIDGWVPNPPLPPATAVEYQVFFYVGAELRAFEAPLTMVTPPAQNEPLVFLALGNTSARGTTWALPYGDPAGDQDDIAGVLAAQAVGSPVQFLVVPGDMVIRNNVYDELYDPPTHPEKPGAVSIEAALDVEAADHRFYTPYASVLCHTPFYVVPGDEDLEVREARVGNPRGIENDDDYSTAYVAPLGLAADVETWPPLTEQWYFLEAPHANFAMIRSSWPQEPNEQKFPGALIALKDTMALLRRLQCSDSRWKIVVVHHPPYTSKDTDLGSDQVPDRQQFLWNLEHHFGGFESYGVDLVISAHEKLFELSHAVRATAGPMPWEVTEEVVQEGPDFVDPGAPVYLVTGGGGEPLWECEPGEPGCRETEKKPFTLVVKRVHHVARIVIEDSLLTIEAFDKNGNLIPGTRATIRKNAPFRRGDSNADSQLNLTDGVYTLNYLFLGGEEPPCEDAADANDDGKLNITDGIYVLRYLFLGGDEPPAPGPEHCGIDPTGDEGKLGCAKFPPCEHPEVCRCADEVDNDLDGLTDCEDPDCSSDPLSETCRCDDRDDNEPDGPTDCEDPDCCDDPICGGGFVECHCADGADNDLDGKIDCADADCCGFSECGGWESCHCDDAQDNDLDGFVDCDDPDCAGVPGC